MRTNDLLTPEGTRDLLFEECAAKREISERVTDIFKSYGYSEVITPGLEFFDVFNGKTPYFPQENMYKLVDGKNRLMVLRPDNTMPIARVAATRLRGEELPLKLFYDQNIFLVNPKDSGRDDEIAQSGIEIIGGNSEAADYEALVLAAKALAACDEDYRLEIGDSGIFRELIASCDFDEQFVENIHGWIETKDYPMLDSALMDADKPAEKALKALPRLFGGMEVFDKAREFLKGEVLEAKLVRQEKLCKELSEIIPAEKIRVDLGLVHKRNYYTGLMFRGYVEGYGQPALSGGRYDTLLGDFGREAGAVGFAVNVEAAAKVFLRKAKTQLLKKVDVLVFGEAGAEIAALKHCEKLISDGRSVYNFLGECPKCAAKYAKAHGISRIDFVKADGAITSEEV
ncbi:MAG: ATP phosphoribosyltransferase regulatory subunit [Oscillospiraceae bacterium]|nr:ATP phosphoribosyltransferase regulatory subunit [Oscillospiraceae bacterium]